MPTEPCDRQEIDPSRLYPFSVAARLIPSCRAGKRLSIYTLYRWRKMGRLRAEARQSGRKRYWFVSGVELMRLQAPRNVEFIAPAELNRRHERAMERLRQRGLTP